MKIVKYIGLSLWLFWGIFEISKNFNHYSLLDWIIVFAVLSIPFIIWVLRNKNNKANIPVELKSESRVSDFQPPTLADSEDNQIKNHQKLCLSRDILSNEYAITLFLDAYKKGSPLLKDKDYWGYLKYGCKISHPRKFHESLIEHGYFRKMELSEYLSTYKVNELKTILESIGQIKTGKKSDLIERIVNTLSDEEKRMLFTNSNYFLLSPKGEQFLNLHSDYIQLKKWTDGSITVQDYDSAKASLPFKAGFYDILWCIYNNRQLEYCYHNRYPELIDTYLQMSNVLFIEKRYTEAIYYIVRSLYIELSGATEFKNIHIFLQDKTFTKQDLMELYLPSLPIYSINLFRQIQDNYNDSVLDRVYTTTKIPFNITPHEDFINFIHEIISGKEFSEEFYQKNLRERYWIYIKNI